jgi:hypothetical protein
MSIGGALAGTVLVRFDWVAPPKLEESAHKKIDAFLGSADPAENAIACLAIMEVTWHWCFALEFTEPSISKSARKQIPARLRRQTQRWAERVVPLIDSGEITLQLAAIWAAIWLRMIGAWTSDIDSTILGKFAHIWQGARSPELQYLAAWAISTLPFKERGVLKFSADSSLTELVQSAMGSSKERPLWRSAKRKAAIILAYYMGAPWTDEQWVEKLKESEGFPSRPEMLKALEQPFLPAALP